MQGEVVGMTTLGDEGGQNLNFAVPCNALSKFLNSAINKPARAPIQPKNPAVPSRPKQRQTPKAPKSSKGSGIPLPDANGFLVHKCGCSVERIRRYVSSPLKRLTEGLYSTSRKFKVLKARLDTKVSYFFIDDKLRAINFLFDYARNIEQIITQELTEIYHQSPYSRYEEANNSTFLVRTWYLMV